MVTVIYFCYTYLVLIVMPDDENHTKVINYIGYWLLAPAAIVLRE